MKTGHHRSAIFGNEFDLLGIVLEFRLLGIVVEFNGDGTCFRTIGCLGRRPFTEFSSKNDLTVAVRTEKCA